MGSLGIWFACARKSLERSAQLVSSSARHGVYAPFLPAREASGEIGPLLKEARSPLWLFIMGRFVHPDGSIHEDAGKALGDGAARLAF